MSLKFAVLGLLSETPQTGYDLKRSFDGSIGNCWQATFQQIYAELRKLERERFIVAEKVHQRPRPTKKIYSLTPKGEAALREWLDTPSAPLRVRDEFLVKVFLITRIPPERALERLAEHRTQHEARLAAYRAIESRLREAGCVSDDGVAEAALGRYMALRRGLGYEEESLKWCDWAMRLLERRLGH